MTTIEATSTEMEMARSATPVPFVAGLVLSPAEARTQVEAIRELQRSVMVEGRDYGTVAGIDRPTLFKSGAELLLKVHGYGHRLERVEVERDEHGRKFGLTYRCVVTVGPAHAETVVATCDGYCGYDETKYYQSVAQLEARERANAAKYQRPARPDKWAEEYRAPWNTLLKMAEKRALVGAALQATAASGLFTQDVEDDIPPVPAVLPAWAQLGYVSEEELRATNDPLVEAMRAVPEAGRDAVAAVFDRLGYPRGSRFPVAKEHAGTIRDLLAAATGGADPETGEIPPAVPSAAETAVEAVETGGYDDPDGAPFEPEAGGETDGRPYLDSVYLHQDELGNWVIDHDALAEALDFCSEREITVEATARGLGLSGTVEQRKARLAQAIRDANPLPEVTSRPEGRPAPDHSAANGTDVSQPELPDNLSPAKESGSKRSAGSQVHVNLANLGVRDKEAQEAIIAAASVGRTSHASELSKTEAQIAYGLAKTFVAGEITLDEIRKAAKG